MRRLLMAAVLLLTGGTFYSALWHKSEAIEDDITARVTDALESEGASDIDIDVDGRHVTLSGIVFDENQEQGYLNTADETFGALGPIDGLTFQTDNGLIQADKTAEGITLRGTVPNEAARAALIEQAQAATDGEVTDALTIGGPEADWQDEAQFGLSQMGMLTTGTLTASAATLSLSGSTDGDADAVNATLNGRDGWRAFVSAPSERDALSADVARLSADVSARNGRINALETDVARLTGERDTLQSDLDALQASLSAGETDTASLREQLATAQGMIVEKDETIAALTSELEAQGGQIAIANEEAARLDGIIAEQGEMITALQADLDSQGGTDEQIVALRAEVETRDATIEDLNSQLATTQADVTRLNEALAGTEGSAAETAARLATATAALSSRNTEVEALRGNVSDLTEQLATSQIEVDRLSSALSDAESAAAEQSANAAATVSSTNEQVAALRGEVEDLTATVAERDDALQTTAGRLTALEGEVTDLTAVVADRDATIAALQARPAPSANAGLVAQQCAAQATSALEGSRINFATGTADIDGESVELLERLTGIALACVGDDLTVEIGGHTDAQGSEENNQVLSEARAQAVVDFMVARGVAEEGLRAVGFGEAQPIADNDTDAGRAQNRRISFDWQAQ